MKNFDRNTAVLISLIFVYTGYYYCRSILSTCTKIFKNSPEIIYKDNYSGPAFTIGYICYAIGKLAAGYGLQRFKPYYILHGCILIVICATAISGTLSLTTSTSAHIFTSLWGINRIFQGGGWPAIVFYIREAFDPASHGKMIGIAALSYNLGDFVVRISIGGFDRLGVSWNNLYFMSASFAVILSIPSLLLMERTIKKRNSKSVETKANSLVSKVHIRFWVLFIQCPCFVWLREIFLSLGPTILSDIFLDNDSGYGTMLSSISPFFGAFSCAFGGFIVDRYKNKRSTIYLIFTFFTACSLVLLLLGVIYKKLAIFIIGCMLMSLFAGAPTSWVEGVMLFDVVNPKYLGIAFGAVHFSGSIGAALCGSPVLEIKNIYGWTSVFTVSLLIGVFNFLLAVFYCILKMPPSNEFEKLEENLKEMIEINISSKQNPETDEISKK